jgi:glycosyltransferase involved in cell wall biosynthesis
MRMKLLLYSHDWLPTIGGVQTITMSLARGLTEAACDVTVVTETPAGGMDDATLPFRVLRRPGWLRLWRQIREADVIHLAGPAFLPLLTGWIAGKPTVVEHHGYYAACPNALLLYHPTQSVCPGYFLARDYGKCVLCNAAIVGFWKSVRMLLKTFPRRWLACRATRHVSPSAHIGRRIALPHTQTIYHGQTIEPAGAATTPQAPGPLPFAFVGRFVPEKGVAVLLRAARRLADEGRPCDLKLIGDGPQQKHLEGLTQDLGLTGRVEYTGYLKGEELRATLRDTAAIVMPSLCEEVAPLVAIEQMAEGRLLISSDLGGLAEYVGDAGLKFAPGDTAALADCMRQVLDKPELVRKMEAAARDRAVRLFGHRRMVEEHLQLFRELLPPGHPEEARVHP